MSARFALVLVLGLLAGAVGAGAAGPPQSPISIDELVESALSREPGLQAMRREIDAAMARERQSAERPNPMLTVSRSEQAGGTDNNTLIGFAWPLDLWRKSARVAAAEHETAAARAEVHDRERRLAADVRRAAGVFLGSVRDRKVAEDLAQASRRFAELVDARVREGAAPALEGGLSRVETARIESERLLREGRAETALLDVKRLAGMMTDEPLALRENLEEAVRAGANAKDEEAASALDDRPDVRAAAARVATAGAREEQAVSEGRADASVIAGYSRADMGFPQLGLGPTGSPEPIRAVFHRIEVGMSWQLPLRSRNQGEIAAIRSEGMAAEREGARIRLGAEFDLVRAEVRERQAEKALEIYRSEVVEQARENLEVLRQSYALGRALLLDVLAEERRYLDVEEGYTKVLLEVYESQVDGREARDSR